MPAPLSTPSSERLTAFSGFRRIASGSRSELIDRLRAEPPPSEPLLRVFDDRTGHCIDLDLRPPTPDAPDAADASEAVLAPDPESGARPARGVGRPKLGVVAREVTLLPRHWEWLAQQSGGASVALRLLVDEARRTNQGRDALQTARETTYRFMSEIAGDLPGFEEAARALFAGERGRFAERIAPWPEDVHAHLVQLSGAAWEDA